MIKINFTCFSFFQMMATRKYKITFVTHVCGLRYISAGQHCFSHHLGLNYE